MSALTLTPRGRQAAENTQAAGPKFSVLSLLYEASGPVEVEEVIDATDMDADKAQMILRALISDGLIKEV